MSTTSHPRTTWSKVRTKPAPSPLPEIVAGMMRRNSPPPLQTKSFLRLSSHAEARSERGGTIIGPSGYLPFVMPHASTKCTWRSICDARMTHAHLPPRFPGPAVHGHPDHWQSHCARPGVRCTRQRRQCCCHCRTAPAHDRGPVSERHRQRRCAGFYLTTDQGN